MSKLMLSQAVYKYSEGNIYEAYQLYIQSGLYNSAHELAVLELAPEAVIRNDLELLESLFERIAGHPVDNWHSRGKVCTSSFLSDGVVNRSHVSGLSRLRGYRDQGP